MAGLDKQGFRKKKMNKDEAARKFIEHLRTLLPHLNIDVTQCASCEHCSFDIGVRISAPEPGDTKSPDILDTPDGMCTLMMEKPATATEPYECVQHYSVFLCDGLHVQIMFECKNTKLVFRRCFTPNAPDGFTPQAGY